MSTTPTPELPPARCRAIARMVLGDECAEQDIVALAKDIGRFVAEFPPLTQEQTDKIAVLLRPAPYEAGRSFST